MATSSEEKKDLKRRFKLQREEIDGLSMRVSAWRQKQLITGLDRDVRTTQTNTNLSRNDHVDGGAGARGAASELAAKPPDTHHRARLALQPSALVSFDHLLGTLGVAGKERCTPEVNQLYLNSEFVSGKDKIPLEKLMPKAGVDAKRGGSGESDVRDGKRAKVEAARSGRTAGIMKQCGNLLKNILFQKHEWFFNNPVDAQNLHLHNYHKVTKTPMDLGTIKKKLDGGSYVSALDFSADIRLAFANAMTYNPSDHDLHAMTPTLRNLFEEQWKKIEEKMDEDRMKTQVEEETLNAEGEDQSEHYSGLEQQTRGTEGKLQPFCERPGGDRPGAQPKPKPDDLEMRSMNFEKKRKLSVALEDLSSDLDPDKLDQVVQIMKKRNPNLSHNEDEMVVDINSFDNVTLWGLYHFLIN